MMKKGAFLDWKNRFSYSLSGMVGEQSFGYTPVHAFLTDKFIQFTAAEHFLYTIGYTAKDNVNAF